MGGAIGSADDNQLIAERILKLANETWKGTVLRGCHAQAAFVGVVSNEDRYPSGRSRSNVK